MRAWFTTLTDWLRPERRAARRLPAVLARFHDPRADPLHLARELVDCLRPQRRGDQAYLTRYHTMLDTLEADAGLRQAFRQRVCQPPAADLFYRQRHPARQRVFF